MRHILLIKTSSMGDLIHTFPALTDLDRHFRSIGEAYQLTWVAEEAFIEIAKMHPATQKTIPVAIRRWRKNLFKRETWREYRTAISALKAQNWDYVIDAQGLVKSAFLAKKSKRPIHGYDRVSAREGAASRAYTYHYSVPWNDNYSAVERNRQLFSAIFGYEIESEADFGLSHWHSSSPHLPSQPFVPLLHGTSAVIKEWPETKWIELGQWLESIGLQSILFWGNEREERRAEFIASAIPNAKVMPKMSLQETGEIIAQASAVVAVDTGLAHLANTQNRPMVTLFLNGPTSYAGPIPTAEERRVINLGGKNECPSVESVIEALKSFNLTTD